VYNELSRQACNPESCECNAGLTNGPVELFDRPTQLFVEIIYRLKIFSESFLAAMPGVVKMTLGQDVCNDPPPDLQIDQGVWLFDYVRLRFQMFHS
jgi:hypothetical protein